MQKRVQNGALRTCLFTKGFSGFKTTGPWPSNEAHSKILVLITEKQDLLVNSVMEQERRIFE